MSGFPENLPAQLNPMVGRKDEIGDLIGLLKDPDAGLITLHGTGGVGKTRLAVETGRAALELFPDGVWFVALAPLSSAAHIVPATADALGFAFQSHDGQQGQLTHYLHRKKLLLIFDNLEHLLPEGAVLLQEILQNARDSRLLVTSRRPIDAPWERVYPLSGLEVGSNSSLENGELPAAVQLFLQHLSRIAGPAAGNNRVCATRISRIVGGLPLALLLAASWGRALECDEILQELQRGIGFLETRQKTFPEQHRSMQAIFDYSWRLLPDPEKAALRKLSVFRGGFDREAAARVAGADLALLASFIDHSMVDRVSRDRYQIHELLRQYLSDRLVEAGEEKSIQGQHLALFVQRAEQAEPLLVGKHQKAEFAKLQLEIDNIRTALDWIQAMGGTADLQKGLRLMASLERFWLIHTYIHEGYTHLVRMLDRHSDLLNQDPHARAYGRSLNVAAKLSFLLEDLPASRRFAEEALRIGLELNDGRVVADSYFHRGVEAVHRVELATARPLLEEALENYRRCEYLPGATDAICCLGRVDMFTNDLPAAFNKLSTALDLARQEEDTRTICASLRSLGQLGIIDPQIGLQRASEYYAESLDLARELEDKRFINYVLCEMGDIARLEGEFEQAAALLEEAGSITGDLGQKDESLRTQLDLGFVYLELGKYDLSWKMFLDNLAACQLEEHLALELSLCLLGLARLMVTDGKPQLAARILGAIERKKELLLPWPLHRDEHLRTLAFVAGQLGERRFNRLFKEGQALSRADAAQLIQTQGLKEKGRDVERVNQLTKREIEILRHVAQGLSDAQIAERLVLSPRTVNAHLTSIYRKLEVNSRAAATRFAIENGLA